MMRRICLWNILEVSLICALIISSFVSSSCCRMGYDIEANVDSSTWSIHRSTQGLDFFLQGVVIGQGTFSRSSQIEGTTGIDAKERSSSTKQGNLSYADQLVLRSREGPVVVTTKLVSGSNTSTNVSQMSVRESARIEIDETWPTYFASYKKISYLGRDIRASESYSNNGDVISTYVDSWKLSKENLYKARMNRTLISVNITPGYIFETRSANRSSFYAMDLDSVGASTKLDIQSKGSYGRPVHSISQDYVGQEKISMKVEMNESLILPKGNESWLQCCP